MVCLCSFEINDGKFTSVSGSVTWRMNICRLWLIGKQFEDCDESVCSCAVNVQLECTETQHAAGRQANP